jgi:hypothetical protein
VHFLIDDSSFRIGFRFSRMTMQKADYHLVFFAYSFWERFKVKV